MKLLELDVAPYEVVGDSLGKPPIGLSGSKGAGKDSVAAYLMEVRSGMVRLSFADPLKDIMRVLGFTEAQLYDPVEKERVDPFWEASPRTIIQLVGTEALRYQVRQDIWVKLMEREIRTAPDKVTVIPDVRFPNEAEMIRSLGGVVLRVERADNPLAMDSDQHVSERGLPEGMEAAIIKNDGSREDLRETTSREVLPWLERIGVL
jgi:hypothetical protein